MKALQNNFTTPEQSKQLLELGVPAYSADCYYSQTYRTIVITDEQIDKKEFYKAILPIWSVGRLMEIYVIARGLDTAYLPIEMGEDMVKYLIRLYEEKARDLDFSKLED